VAAPWSLALVGEWVPGLVRVQGPAPVQAKAQVPGRAAAGWAQPADPPRADRPIGCP